MRSFTFQTSSTQCFTYTQNSDHVQYINIQLLFYQHEFLLCTMRTDVAPYPIQLDRLTVPQNIHLYLYKKKIKIFI